MIPVLNWMLEHWFLIFLLFAFGFFEGVRDFIMDVLDRMVAIATRDRPRDKIADSKPQLEKTPGPCVHRQVSPVVSTTGEVVAWLCRGCDTKLPAGWAVREEGL